MKYMLPLIPLLLCACDPAVDRNVSGSIDNQSSYVLTVTVKEGCYDGSTHNFDVGQGEAHPYTFKYLCNDHDGRTDSVTVAYKNYSPASYDYFYIDLQPFKRTPLAEGDTISYFEDDQLMTWQLKSSDLNSTISVGNSYITESFVALNGQTLKIRPSVEGVEKIYIGIDHNELSPVLTVPGSIDDGTTVFIPMNKKIFQTVKSYHGIGGRVLCNDYECK